jgi:hypothetical protein
MEGVEFNLEYRLMKEQIGRTTEQANENKKAETTSPTYIQPQQPPNQNPSSHRPRLRLLCLGPTGGEESHP